MEEEVSKKERNSERGKKSRAKGQRFELKIRDDLEKKGWIVSKWMNTVDCDKNGKIGKIVPAKRKYNPFAKVMTIGTGFPDFVCFKRVNDVDMIEGTILPSEYQISNPRYEVIGLEVKGNGYLDQIEKGMCIWLLENNIFSKILIAKRSKKKGEVEYIDFSEKYKNK